MFILQRSYLALHFSGHYYNVHQVIIELETVSEMRANYCSVDVQVGASHLSFIPLAE